MSVLGVFHGDFLVQCDGEREHGRCRAQVLLDTETGFLPDAWREQRGPGGPRHWCPDCRSGWSTPAAAVPLGLLARMLGFVREVVRRARP